MGQCEYSRFMGLLVFKGADTSCVGIALADASACFLSAGNCRCCCITWIRRVSRKGIAFCYAYGVRMRLGVLCFWNRTQTLRNCRPDRSICGEGVLLVYTSHYCDACSARLLASYFRMGVNCYSSLEYCICVESVEIAHRSGSQYCKMVRLVWSGSVLHLYGAGNAGNPVPLVFCGASHTQACVCIGSFCHFCRADVWLLADSPILAMGLWPLMLAARAKEELIRLARTGKLC